MSSSTSELYSAAKTGIFWDLDDCPIPNDLSLASVYDNIISALKNKGYTGTVSITAYSLKTQIEKEFESAAIKLVQPGDSRSKYDKMFADVFGWAIRNCYEPTNLMVISKKLEDFDYGKALLYISEKQNNILLALHQHTPSKLLLSIASSVWLWASLSTGGSPFHDQSGCLQVVTTAPTSSSGGEGSQLRANKKQMKRGFKRGHKKRKNRAVTRSEASQ